MKELQGSGVALVTPFHEDGQIDFESLGKLIDFQIENGINYLVSLGTTGESATLNKEEKYKIWDFTAKKVDGRVPLVVGIGGNNTYDVAKTISEFNIEGYCAILSVSPYYNKPTQDGIYQHYKTIADTSPLPIILYNVPSRTGTGMSAETIIRLANDFENIVAVKEASGNFAQFNQIIRDKPEGFLLISGDDPVIVPMMSIGAVGVISVLGNAFPKEIATITRFCSEGKFSEARPIHNKILRLIDYCFHEGNPGGIKYMLSQKGICKNTLRLPLVRISAATETLIQNEIKNF